MRVFSYRRGGVLVPNREHMKHFISEDYETPIEEYPGILGCTWDGELTVIDPVLEALQSFDLLKYSELLDEREGPREVFVRFGGEDRKLTIEAYADLAWILDQVPSVEVFRDEGPPDGGPASGSGYLFFLKEGHSYHQLTSDIRALCAALIGDFARLAGM